MSHLVLKHPDEEYSISIDFSGEDRLPTGATIASGVASSINARTEEDSTSDIIADTDITISTGNFARVKIQGGNVDENHIVTCTFTLTNADILVQVFQIRITLDP